MPRRKKGRNPDGIGGYEELPSGLVRHKRTVNGQRLKGPGRPTRELALAAWEEQHLSKPDETAAPEPVLTWEYMYRLCNRENGELDGEQAKTTVSLLRSIYNRYVREHPFGQVPIGSWTAPMAREWARAIPVQPRTLDRYVAAMKGVWRRAIVDELATSNPWVHVKVPAYERESEKTVLPRHKQKDLLAILEGRTRDAAVLWLQNLRRGEACGLRYEDFDGEGVTIRRQVLELDTGVIVRELTKNKKRRWVPLDAEGIELLSRKKEGWVLPATKRRKGRAGKAADDTAAIVRAYGSMCCRPHNVYGDLVEALKGTEFEGTHPHDYRSSAGTDFMRVADLRTAAEIMGHAPEVLAKHYARSDSEAKRKAVRDRG